MSSLLSSCLRLVVANPLAGSLHQSVRTRMRFPLRFPSETKRYRKCSWDVRISTPTGKNLIMKRILKRKQVLCGF